MMGIIGAEFQPSLRLLYDVELISLLQSKTRKQLLRQDDSYRISYFADLKDSTFDFRLFVDSIHGDLVIQNV